jgi:hypothetical protein
MQAAGIDPEMIGGATGFGQNSLDVSAAAYKS